MRWIPVLFLGVLAVAGCLSKPALVAQEFTLDPPPPRTAAPTPGGRVVAFLPVRLAPAVDNRSFLFRRADHQAEYDPYARFAASPGELLWTAIRGYVQNDPLVGYVVEPGSDVAADFTLGAYAGDLCVDDTRPGGPAAVLTLRFRVLSSVSSPGGAQVVLDRHYSRVTPLAQPTPFAAASAWNKSLADIMEEFLSDVKPILSAPAK
jgi:hypothetical protein